MGLSNRPARLHRLAKSIPWNRFLARLSIISECVAGSSCRAAGSRRGGEGEGRGEGGVGGGRGCFAVVSRSPQVLHKGPGFSENMCMYDFLVIYVKGLVHKMD
jgi:hypothetical protein